MHSSINAKVVEGISQIFKVLGDPTRISILLLLEQSEMNVTTIAENLSMEQSAVSHQLKVLKDVRVVKARREGKSKIYSLDDDHIFSLLSQARDHVVE